MKLGTKLIAILIGTGLSVLILIAAKPSYFSSWQRVPDPPTQASVFAPSWNSILYVRNQAGQVFGREIKPDDSWFQSTETITEARHPHVAKRPCEPTNPAFAIGSFPPSNVLDCVQGREMYADGFSDFVYIIDGNHTIWQWSNTHAAFDVRNNTKPVVLIASCLLVGLGVLGLFSYAYSQTHVDAAQRDEP